MTTTPEPRPITSRPLHGPASGGDQPQAVRRFADVMPSYGSSTGGSAGASPSAGDRREPPVRSPNPPEPIDLRAEHRHIASIARVVGQAAFESMAGIRPVHQLARWLDPESFEKICDRVQLTTTAHQSAGTRLYRNTAVRRTRLCRVGEGVYEASLVVVDQTRVRAAALRIELRRGQWKVSALEIG
ncbi:Rv3235 family protein [Arthrobacter sp. KK5.5]|uniref:Rv3235 family protein n=1 Tax=Arthrobacter sp. KK5.5 TaxID=3373084 RepID=UPI003EE5DD67